MTLFVPRTALTGVDRIAPVGSASNMSMFSTGVLVLTAPLHTLPLRITPVLSSAARVVKHTLYVHLHPGLNLSACGGGGGGSGGGAQPRPVFIPPVPDLSTAISRLYSNTRTSRWPQTSAALL